MESSPTSTPPGPRSGSPSIPAFDTRQSLQAPRLLVTDLDGTLLNPEGQVHPCDREAIDELRARGVQVSIVTGRMYSGTMHVAHELGLIGPVGCIDGSQIVDTEHDRELLRVSIRGPSALALQHVLDTPALITVVFADDTLFVDDSALQHLSYLTKWSTRVRLLESVMRDFPWEHPEGLAGTVSLGPRAEIESASRSLLEGSGLDLQSTTFAAQTDGPETLWGMIVRAAGTSKATAMEWIAHHYGVALENVVAVGDWVNDIPMLSRAGRSFAMAQSPAAVREAATDVLEADTWAGGGIAEAARRSGLL